MDYESVIGLEVHVQIKTDSKLFCSCPTVFGAPPNSNICPVCSGYPGCLPVLNRKAVESGVRTALALGCEVREESVFARKQYFYPDLPKNYQISQYEKPLAEGGELFVETAGRPEPLRVRILRVHLEEDAGKLIHPEGAGGAEGSLVDLNRTGIPLMEIVSEPDLRSSEDAQRYLEALKSSLEYLGVSGCDMEKGSLRCDANVSIRPAGSRTLGTKVELKNMNSFRGVRDAVDYEIARQTAAVESGGRIVQETRLWDAEKGESRPMRSKEEAHDYRYFPEPDLPPLAAPKEWVESLRAALPEMPRARRERFTRDYHLTGYDARVLTAQKELGDYYEAAWQLLRTVRGDGREKLLANWVTTELLGRLNAGKMELASSPVPAESMAGLVRLILDGTLSGKIAKTVFDEMWATGGEPAEIVQKKGLVQVLDEGRIREWAKEALARNRKAADEFRSGKERALGSLVGAVMKASGGKANPEIVNRILLEELGSGKTGG
ncbi:MAG: aspartyl/glutamyl-tRNA amidotransferase subunit B [Elusimicrobia bacterium RIFCSPLOWO2_01_FULL_64_13]|nr:MAG: aspartyl/glutamyl-tRNA amidotransferase subunit B [Elusimicrobia bacterium RIFCSPLOWO2_01_FULL_64_13]